MERQSINSEMISTAGYDASSGTLEIEFRKGGAIWQYLDVPESTWHEFLSAESQGKFWNANVKNRFREVRVG
jgi:hypothetical protein